MNEEKVLSNSMRGVVIDNESCKKVHMLFLITAMTLHIHTYQYFPAHWMSWKVHSVSSGYGHTHISVPLLSPRVMRCAYMKSACLSAWVLSHMPTKEHSPGLVATLQCWFHLEVLHIPVDWIVKAPRCRPKIKRLWNATLRRCKSVLCCVEKVYRLLHISIYTIRISFPCWT